MGSEQALNLSHKQKIVKFHFLSFNTIHLYIVLAYLVPIIVREIRIKRNIGKTYLQHFLRFIIIKHVYELSNRILLILEILLIKLFADTEYMNTRKKNHMLVTYSHSRKRDRGKK